MVDLGGGEGIVIADFLVSCTELSLTVPITNSLAFLFTVLGEWWAEGKVISRGNTFFFSLLHLLLPLLHPHQQLPCASFCVGKPLHLLTTTSTEQYRYLDRNGVCAWWYRAVRSVEEYMSPSHGVFMDMIWVSPALHVGLCTRWG